MIIYTLFIFFIGILYFFLAQKQFKILGKNGISTKFLILATLLSLVCFVMALAYAVDDDIIFINIYKFEFCVFLFSILIVYRLIKLAITGEDGMIYLYIPPILLSVYFIYFADFSIGKMLTEKGYVHFSAAIYYFLFIFLIIFTLMKREYNEYTLERSLIKDTVIFVLSLVAFIFYYLFEIKQVSLVPYDFAIVIYGVSLYYLSKVLNKISFASMSSDEAMIGVVENSNYLIVVTDEIYNVVFTNKKFQDFIGKDIVGESLKEIFLDEEIFNEDEDEDESKDFKVNFLAQKDTSLEVMVKHIRVGRSIIDSERHLFVIEKTRSVIQACEKLRIANKKLTKTIAEEVKRLEERNSELEKNLSKKESLEYQIQDIFCYDTLTGLYNRNYFMQNFESTLNEDADSTHALMFLDLDGFKSINDSLGHSYGDDVIIEVAKRLRQNYKYKNAIISRFGGDEFVILFREVKNEDEVATYAENILEIIKEPIYFDNAKIHLSTSIGIAMYPRDGDTTGELLKSADTAMYESKEKGRSQYNFFEDKFRWRIQNEYNITKDLINAVPNNELILFYQPQIRVMGDTAIIVGFESLMRWEKDGKLVSPGMFIPVAEKTNIISEMGKWAIKEACEQCKTWNEMYGTKVKIAINLSANQLMNPMLEDEVATALLSSGVSPELIELEITESAILKNMQHSIAKLNALKAYGVKISIDDFGTKYSTFNYLKQLPVDKIKIDISFVRSIGNNKIDEAIILSLIKLTKELKIDIIAEGVETEEQLNFLVEHGCDMIQGFYFFAPMPVEKVEEGIGNQNVFNSENIFDYKKIENELKA